MLIRSQDKKKLINMDLVPNIEVAGTKVYENFSYIDGYDVLGEYSTEAKAIKVLDKIQDMYKTFEVVRGDIAYRMEPPKVFQMPPDEEVEEGAVKVEKLL